MYRSSLEQAHENIHIAGRLGPRSSRPKPTRRPLDTELLRDDHGAFFPLMSSLVGGGTDITGAMDMFATFSCERVNQHSGQYRTELRLLAPLNRLGYSMIVPISASVASDLYSCRMNHKALLRYSGKTE